MKYLTFFANVQREVPALARDALVGNDRHGEPGPENEPGQGRVDFPAFRQEVDRGPAHEIAVEASGRHRFEREALQRAVVEVRGGSRRPRLGARGPRREHRGCAAPPRGDQPGQELRRLLEIGGKDRGRIAGRVLEAREDRHLRPEVAGQADASRPRPVSDDLRHSAPGVVLRSVVHEDRLHLEVRGAGNLPEPVGQRLEGCGVEIHRHDYGDPLVSHPRRSKKSRTPAVTASTCSSDIRG